MKRNLLILFTVCLSMFFCGAVTAFALPPDNASVPEHVKKKQIDKAQDHEINQEKDMEQDQDQEDMEVEKDSSNTSKSIGHVGKAGQSHVGHMYLFEKNPTTWNIVEDGAWGKMRYTVEGPKFDFVFNGHGLETGEDYTLIYYPDPWPGEGLICLGNGSSTNDGNLHIMGSKDIGDLPKKDDDNAENSNGKKTGAKIWLVRSNDINCTDTCMTKWNPEEYLFEYDLITYDDTDDSENGSKETDSIAQTSTTTDQMPPFIRSDLDIFIPKAKLHGNTVSFKLEYCEDPDEEGIYFKLDEDSLTIDGDE